MSMVYIAVLALLALKTDQCAKNEYIAVSICWSCSYSTKTRMICLLYD